MPEINGQPFNDRNSTQQLFNILVKCQASPLAEDDAWHTRAIIAAVTMIYLIAA